jgi:hypothetical protein
LKSSNLLESNPRIEAGAGATDPVLCSIMEHKKKKVLCNMRCTIISML